MLSERRRHARALFAPLGPTYDRVGATLSFGQDPRWRRFLVARLPTDRGHVLDVATGTGLVAEALLARGFRVTGLDQSAEMLAVASKRFGDRVELVEAPADALPFPDASFDTVVCTFALCAIPDERRAVGEMIRVLRPGGLLLLADHIAGATWPVRGLQRILELATVPLQGEHMLRRPLRQVQAEGLQIERRERFKAGMVERLAARKAATG